MNIHKCRYCESLGVCVKGCPTLAEKPEWAMAQWTEGYTKGFADEYIHRDILKYHRSEFFRRGYCKGRIEIEIAMDNAHQANYGLGL